MWNIPLTINAREDIQICNQIEQCTAPLENIIRFKMINQHIHGIGYSNPIYRNYHNRAHSNFQLLALSDLQQNDVTMSVFLEEATIPEDGRNIHWPFMDTGASRDDDYDIIIRYITSGKSYAKHINPKNRTNLRIADEEIERLKVIEQTLQRNKLHVIRIYKSKRKLEIITSTIDQDFVQSIIAMVPTIFPEAFKPRNERTLCWDILKEVALKTDATKIQQLLQRYTELNPILRDYENTKIIRLMQQLSQQRTQAQQTRVRTDKDRWQAAENSAKEYYEIYMETLQTLSDMQANQDVSEDLKEFVDYIQHHKSVKEINVIDNMLLLRIQTPLTQISEDALQHNYLRPTSDTPRTIKKLFQKTFLENTYEIWTEACLKLNIMTGTIERDANTPLTGTLFRQPHIMRYNCFGNHTQLIRARYDQKDYIGAFEQIIAATRNLNFTDGTVVSKCITDILEQDNKASIYDKAEEKFITFNEFEEKECNNGTN